MLVVGSCLAVAELHLEAQESWHAASYVLCMLPEDGCTCVQCDHSMRVIHAVLLAVSTGKAFGQSQRVQQYSTHSVQSSQPYQTT